MNEHSPPSPSPAANSTPAAGASPSNPLRKILFGILAVMLVALAYDYGIVRPSYRNAEAKIDDLMDQRLNVDEGPITPDTVRAAFGKSPQGGLRDEGEYFVEHYQWRRGLPWQTFDLYVVYDHNDPPRLFNSTRPHAPTATEVPLALPTGDLQALAPPPSDGGNASQASSPERPASEGDAEGSASEAGEATTAASPSETEPAAAAPAATEPTDAPPPTPATDDPAPASEKPQADQPPQDEAAPAADEGT